MTEEQSDAVVGRAVRDYADADRKMRVLVARAQQVGRQLCSLGELLQEHPFGVVSTANGFAGGDVAGDSSLLTFVDALSYENLRMLESDIRQTAKMLRQARGIKNSVC